MSSITNLSWTFISRREIGTLHFLQQQRPTKRKANMFEQASSAPIHPTLTPPAALTKNCYHRSRSSSMEYCCHSVVCIQLFDFCPTAASTPKRKSAKNHQVAHLQLAAYRPPVALSCRGPITSTPSQGAGYLSRHTTPRGLTAILLPPHRLAAVDMPQEKRAELTVVRRHYCAPTGYDSAAIGQSAFIPWPGSVRSTRKTFKGRKLISSCGGRKRGHHTDQAKSSKN